MALSQNSSMEEVTFNIPTELKQKEIEKWCRGISMALEDKEYMALTKEMGRESGDLYE